MILRNHSSTLLLALLLCCVLWSRVVSASNGVAPSGCSAATSKLLNDRWPVLTVSNLEIQIRDLLQAKALLAQERARFDAATANRASSRVPIPESELNQLKRQEGFELADRDFLLYYRNLISLTEQYVDIALRKRQIMEIDRRLGLKHLNDQANLLLNSALGQSSELGVQEASELLDWALLHLSLQDYNSQELVQLICIGKIRKELDTNFHPLAEGKRIEDLLRELNSSLGAKGFLTGVPLFGRRLLLPRDQPKCCGSACSGCPFNRGLSLLLRGSPAGARPRDASSTLGKALGQIGHLIPNIDENSDYIRRLEIEYDVQGRRFAEPFKKE